MKVLFFMASMSFLSGAALAGSPEKGDLYIEGFISGDESDLSRENAFLEYTFRDGDSVFVHAYTDDELTSAYVGMTHSFSEGRSWDLEAGLGIGSARIHHEDHLAFNPWVVYRSGPWELRGETELVTGTEEDEFWRIESFREVGRFDLGIFGENGFGFGPAVGFHLGHGHDRVKLYATHSVSGGFEGGEDTLLYLTFSHHFHL